MARQVLIPYVHTDGQTWPHFFADAKSGVIYFMKSHGGKKIKFSTKEKIPNGVRAKRFANIEFDKRIGKNTRFVRSLIKEELDAWLKFKESEGLSLHTMYAVRRSKLYIAEYWGDRLPSDITRDSFAEWCAWWKIHKPDIQMEGSIKYFNNFCNYLHEKVVGGRPLLASRIRFRDPDRHRIQAARVVKKERILSSEEFGQIMATALNPTEALMVHIMYTMATRIDETLKLDFDRILLDTDPPKYRWTYGNNKAKHTGEHALHLSLIEPLRQLREVRRSEGTNLLFPQKNDNKKALKEQQVDWAAWRDRAKVSHHWTPHTFRHTCLTNLFNNHRNPQAAICKLYRVSLPVAIAVYVKVTPESMIQLRDSIEVSL